ncbi:MAG: hypothetical protein HEQ39_03310 [Rhizobacter sp.]
MGDHLHQIQSPLATAMTLRFAGQPLWGSDGHLPHNPLSIRPDEVSTPVPADPSTRLRTGLVEAQVACATLRQAQGERFSLHSAESIEAKAPALPKVLLLIHGLCMNDLHWNSEHKGRAVNHGETLAQAMGCSLLTLRYNTGLHISSNGQDLAQQLEKLLADWPVPIKEIHVLAHSMGGLVIRSGVHTATLAKMRWPQQLKTIVFLGTPHHGAPLERAGNRVDVILASTPYTAPFSRLAQLRSSGITDLRYGLLLDQDWAGRDRFSRAPDHRTTLPLPEGVACYAVAGAVSRTRGLLAERLVGDGLVPLDSALGQHDDAARRLHFAKTSTFIAYRTNHMALLSSPEVGAQLLKWLKT